MRTENGHTNDVYGQNLDTRGFSEIVGASFGDKLLSETGQRRRQVSESGAILGHTVDRRYRRPKMETQGFLAINLRLA